MKKEINIALVDDHAMLRVSLAATMEKFGYNVMLHCNNGNELIKKIGEGLLPDIAIMDINMPEMDGFQTTKWLRENQPSVKVLALSMYDDETAIIRMLSSGAKGYILKDSDPPVLRQAIEAVMTKGFFYSELVTGSLIHSITDKEPTNASLNLKEREVQFLKLAGTEMTYKEIALQMNVSPRTVDTWRDDLFEKLNAKSRVGLVLYAVKNRIIQIN